MVPSTTDGEYDGSRVLAVAFDRLWVKHTDVEQHVLDAVHCGKQCSLLIVVFLLLSR